MPPASQLRAISAIESPSERASYLTHAGEAAFHTPEDPEGHRTALCVALASSLLQLRDPGSALAALDALPEGRRSNNEAALRAHALLWLGRVNEAITLHGARPTPAGAWLDALRDAVDLAHAPLIASTAGELFAGEMNDRQRVRYDARLARLASVDETQDPDPAPDAGNLDPPTESSGG